MLYSSCETFGGAASIELDLDVVWSLDRPLDYIVRFFLEVKSFLCIFTTNNIHTLCAQIISHDLNMNNDIFSILLVVSIKKKTSYKEVCWTAYEYNHNIKSELS